MSQKRSPLDLCHFLRGAGGAMMSLPFSEAIFKSVSAVSGADETPKRMVCAGNNFGYMPDHFFSTETGADYALSGQIEVLERHKEVLLF
jgi:hypothetical protein